jgi:hypothetical protein
MRGDLGGGLSLRIRSRVNRVSRVTVGGLRGANRLPGRMRRMMSGMMMNRLPGLPGLPVLPGEYKSDPVTQVNSPYYQGP